MTKDSARAERIVADLEKRFPEDTSIRFSYLPVVRSSLALNRGNAAEALALLQTSTPYELSPARVYFGALYPIYARGLAYMAARRGAEAAGQFRRVLEHRGIVLDEPVGAIAQLQLARAYALAGDRHQAKAAYRDFLTAWKDADSGIPVLKQAKAEYAKL